MSLGSDLIMLRQQKDLIRKDAAKAIGISVTTLRKFEHDMYDNTPNFVMLFKITNFYGVSALKLLDGVIAPLD